MAGVGPGGANTPSGPGGLSSQSQSTNFGTQSTNIPGSANGGFGGNGGPGANSGPGGNSGDNSSSPNGGATSGGTDSGSGGSGSSSNGSGSTDSLTGQTFGGLGIIGFSPNSPKKSIMIYKTKDTGFWRVLLGKAGRMFCCPSSNKSIAGGYNGGREVLGERTKFWSSRPGTYWA